MFQIQFGYVFLKYSVVARDERCRRTPCSRKETQEKWAAVDNLQVPSGVLVIGPGGPESRARYPGVPVMCQQFAFLAFWGLVYSCEF